MKIKHTKKYYVGGLISLIFLPILFFVSTIEIRKKAVRYGSIEVLISPHGMYDPIATSKLESLYVFLGNDETTKLHNFQQFCQNMKARPNYILKFNLPEKCSYNFFIQVIDILQINNYLSSLYHKTIECNYSPDLTFHQEYVPASTNEEFHYIYIELSKIFFAIKDYFSEEPVIVIVDRIQKYEDLGPPSEPGTLHFSARNSIKEEPTSKTFIHTIGSWFISIIIVWLLLLVLSLRKSRKLLPNQALKLTE
jgi:hypothetical protein